MVPFAWTSVQQAAELWKNLFRTLMALNGCNLILAVSMMVDKVNQRYVVKISGLRGYSDIFEIPTD